MARQRPTARTAANDDDIVFCAHGFLRVISLNQNPKLEYPNPKQTKSNANYESLNPKREEREFRNS
jgi:hypothetical protein